jgi:hypothetical protein
MSDFLLQTLVFSGMVGSCVVWGGGLVRRCQVDRLPLHAFGHGVWAAVMVFGTAWPLSVRGGRVAAFGGRRGDSKHELVDLRAVRGRAVACSALIFELVRIKTFQVVSNQSIRCSSYQKNNLCSLKEMSMPNCFSLYLADIEFLKLFEKSMIFITIFRRAFL